MAYVPKQLPQEEENQFARQEPTTPNPVPVQGGGSSGTGASGPGAAPGIGSSTQFGSNAAKLSDYLKANQEQVGEFGNQVAGNLTQGYNQAKGSIDKGFSDFGQQVNKGYQQQNPDLVNQAASDPRGFVKDQDNVSKFQSLYNDRYAGPENAEGSGFYGNVNDTVNKALENSSLVGTQSGLGTYLNNNMGANDSTEGMRMLDTSLLMRDPNSAKAIKDAATPYQGLTDYLKSQTQSANQNIGQAKQQADTIRQGVQNRFTGAGGVVPSFQSDFNSRLENARNSTKSSSDTAQSDFLAGKATPDDLKLLGMSPENYGSLQSNQGLLQKDYSAPLSLQSYFNTSKDPSVAINAANFANPDDYATSQALSMLTGQDMGSFLNQDNAGQAGTAPKSLLDFNGSVVNDASQNLSQRDTSFIESDKAAPIQSLYPSDDPNNQQDAIKADIFSRNTTLLTPQQQMWLQNYQAAHQSGAKYIDPNLSNNPALGGVTSPLQSGPSAPNNGPIGYKSGLAGTY